MGDVVLRGCDVSSWQGPNLDWHAIRQEGATFAGVKCSEGTGYLDPCFARNWVDMADAGLTRLAYHFARCDLGTTGAAEASWFLHCLGTPRPTDMVALDLEVGTGEHSAWALEWLHVVERALGVAPFVYSYLDFLQTKLRDPALARHPLWLALYADTCPATVGQWPEVTLWQHTQASDNYPSVGPCDESVIARTLNGLHALGIPRAPSRFLILRDMELRAAPAVDKPYQPIQFCYKGAVLNGTGREQDGWAEVHAGAKTGWLLLTNMRRL